jgi:hypothetical protein
LDILAAVTLLVIVLLAFNHMAGGHHRNVIKPTTAIATRVLSMAVRGLVSVLSSVFRLGAGSIKLLKLGNTKDDNRGP